MALEEQFKEAIEEWKEYLANGIGPSGVPVKISSFASDYFACKAYQKIISIGIDALLLIRELYDKDNSKDHELEVIQLHGLVRAVHEIVGPEEFQIPVEIQGRLKEIGRYTTEWLDKNMGKCLGATI